MRKLVIAILVLLSALTVGTTPAAAASISVIGYFSWDPPFIEDEGPLFTFVNTSNGPLENLADPPARRHADAAR